MFGYRIREWKRRRDQRRLENSANRRIRERIARSPVPLMGDIVIDDADGLRIRGLEALAIRLAQIGEEARNVGRDEVREIGQELNTAGGSALMLEVLVRADSLSLYSGGPTIESTVERVWDGIGEWQR